MAALKTERIAGMLFCVIEYRIEKVSVRRIVKPRAEWRPNVKLKNMRIELIISKAPKIVPVTKEAMLPAFM